MEHTKGKWVTLETDRSIDIMSEVAEDTTFLVAEVPWQVSKYPELKAEKEANARLIAEAGTVTNETGLTPRQLAEQRKNLLELSKRTCFLMEKNNIKDGYFEAIRYKFDELKGSQVVDMKLMKAAIAAATSQEKEGRLCVTNKNKQEKPNAKEKK